MIVKGFADKPWNSVNKVALPEPAVQQMTYHLPEPILSRRAKIHKARFLIWNNADTWGCRDRQSREWRLLHKCLLSDAAG